MNIRNIILLALLAVAILTISAVGASDVNVTSSNLESDCDLAVESSADVESGEILSEGDKEDMNITINYPDKLVRAGYSYIDFRLDNVPSDYPLGSYDIYVDNKFEKTTDNDHYGNPIDLYLLSTGNHSISVSLPGSEKYNPVNLTHNLEICDSLFFVSDEFVLGYGEASGIQTVTLHARYDAKGSFIVKVDGKEFKRVPVEFDDDGLATASVSLSSLKFGTHQIEAIYTGDGKYKRNSLKKTVNITYWMTADVKYDHAIYAYGNYVYSSLYGKNDTELTIYLPKDVVKSPIVTIDGKKYDVKLTSRKGFASFTAKLNYAPIGSSTIFITYPGDSKYPKKTINATIDVIGAVDFSDRAYFNESYTFLRLPDDANGTLMLYLDDKMYKALPLVNGEAKMIIELPTRAESYFFKAVYTGTDYEIENKTDTFYVLPKVMFHDMTYGDTQTVFVEINPDSELNISYYKNNKLVPVKLVNGKGNFTISTDGYEYLTYEKIHNMDLIIVFDGREYYESVTIKPLPSKLVAKDITMYYGDSKTYSLKVWGPMGKIVSASERVYIKIDSKSSYKYTDSSGTIKFKLDLPVGTHKITASFLDAKIITKIVVKQPLSLKKVTVKKSAKKLVLTATLKKGKVAMKSKKITFKFNGKTYNAKTNKFGVAKVTIKKTVLKKLNVGKKVTYQATYLKDTVKKTAIIKK